MKNLFMSRINKLLSTGFFHIFGSSVINKIIVLMTTIILVRILTKDEYGAFSYTWNIYSLVLILNGMGIESGLLQVASERSGDSKFARSVFNYATRFGLRFDFILGLVIILVGIFFPLKIESSKKLLVTLCVLPLIQLVFQLLSTYLRTQKRNQDYSCLQVINSTILFFLSVVFSYLFREKGLVLAYYVSFIISIVFAIKVLSVTPYEKKYIPLSVDAKNNILKISIISMLNAGLSQILYLIDIFIIGLIDPKESIIAVYKVATIIPNALVFIPISFIMYLYPYFAEKKDNKEWCYKKYKLVVFALGSFNLFISVSVYVLAPYIVSIIFGSQYTECVPILRLLSISYFFSGTFRILSGNLLVTQRRLKFNLIVAVLSSVLNIFANYYFIVDYGAIGAAYATFLVVLFSSLCNTLYLIKILTRDTHEKY